MSREENKFVTTVYRKPTFSSVYTYSFLPIAYKFGKFGILWLSDIVQFVPTGLTFIISLLFHNNLLLRGGYSILFIGKYSKTFLNQLYFNMFYIVNKKF